MASDHAFQSRQLTPTAVLRYGAPECSRVRCCAVSAGRPRWVDERRQPLPTRFLQERKRSGGHAAVSAPLPRACVPQQLAAPRTRAMSVSAPRLTECKALAPQDRARPRASAGGPSALRNPAHARSLRSHDGRTYESVRSFLCCARRRSFRRDGKRCVTRLLAAGAPHVSCCPRESNTACGSTKPGADAGGAGHSVRRAQGPGRAAARNLWRRGGSRGRGSSGERTVHGLARDLRVRAALAHGRPSPEQAVQPPSQRPVCGREPARRSAQMLNLSPCASCASPQTTRQVKKTSGCC